MPDISNSETLVAVLWITLAVLNVCAIVAISLYVREVRRNERDRLQVRRDIRDIDARIQDIDVMLAQKVGLEDLSQIYSLIRDQGEKATKRIDTLFMALREEFRNKNDS